MKICIDDYVTVDRLIRLLQFAVQEGVDPNTLVVLSKDGEGNQYSPLAADISTDYRYEAIMPWFGDIYDTRTPEGEEDEDWDIPPDAVPCLILWPVN